MADSLLHTDGIRDGTNAVLNYIQGTHSHNPKLHRLLSDERGFCGVDMSLYNIQHWHFRERGFSVKASRLEVDPQQKAAVGTALTFGLEQVDLTIPAAKLVGLRRHQPCPPISDLEAAVRAALENPDGFPALRRALTPDDRIAIALAEENSVLQRMIGPIVEHVVSAGVARSAITIVRPPRYGDSDEATASTMSLHGVRTEFHVPEDRKLLSYLATTRKGRRIYLNRTIVDADQAVIVSRLGYDVLHGYAGCEGALFPGFSDEETRLDFGKKLSMEVPNEDPWPARREAQEVAWLLGAPLSVFAIEAEGDQACQIVCGLMESGERGRKMLDARWRVQVERLADTVIATITGDPSRHTYSDLARALACAMRVVNRGGRIILLTQAQPGADAGLELLRQAESPEQGLRLLQKQPPNDSTSAYQWAKAAQQASIYLLSALPAETVEEIFAVHLEDIGQVQRLINSSTHCLVLPDAHKTMAVLCDQE